MARYAEGTTVSPESSQQEISGLLRRYGATSFAYAWEDGQAMVAFKAHDRQVRFVLPTPTDRTEFFESPGGRKRTAVQVDAAMESETRRRWRALALAIKAKLEVVASGIASFEDEFLANIVLPDGSTVGDRVGPEIATAYERSVSPPRLLAIGPGGKP